MEGPFKQINETMNGQNINWLALDGIKAGMNPASGSMCLLFTLGGDTFGIEIPAETRESFVAGLQQVNREIKNQAN